MKAIISHDVDHLSVFEHKNFIIPKHILRNAIEIMTGYISVAEWIGRLNCIIKNKWHNLESLMEFNRENDIPATFFFGVSNGMGLDYNVEDARHWITNVKNRGFDVGIHGIACDNQTDINREYRSFEEISGLHEFGMRLHYLRQTKDTLTFLERAGYLFDSSLYDIRTPYKVGNIWEFPLHLMDGYIIESNGKWQNRNLIQSQEMTKAIIDDCITKGIQYFTLLFHDRYFSDSFATWKKWYIWLIQYLKENKIIFQDYRTAITEMNERSSYSIIESET